MVTNDGPEFALLQLPARDRRKRIHPELLDRLAQQDQRLFDLLIRYRAGEPVGDAIAAEMLPAINDKAGRMSPVRLYGRDDLRQELAFELLRTARQIPLHRPAYLTRRLMLDAAKRLTRRLEREWQLQLEEWYHQSDLSLEQVDGEGEDEE